MTVQVSDFELINTLNDNANVHIKDIDGFDRRMVASTFKDKMLEPLATPDSTVLVGGVEAGDIGHYTPKSPLKGTVFADRRYGVSPDNTALGNGTIITELLEQYKEVVIVENIPLEGVIVKNIFNTLRGLGNKTIDIKTAGASCVTFVKGAIHCALRDLTITCFADNSTAIDINGDLGVGSAPQYLSFYDIFTEGNKTPTTCWDGTVSLKMKTTWSNSFYSCRFNRTQDGIHFGQSGASGNSVNANYFYGCEVRSVNSYTNGGSPVRHYVGDGNAFIGGIIENWKQRMEVFGGDLTITAGAYIEAIADACSLSIYGGTVKITECYRPGFVFVHSTDARLIYKENNNENIPAISYSYPLVQLIGDVNPVIEIDQKGVDATVFRYGEYNTGSGWAASSFKNLRQSVRFYDSSFGLHCINDQLDVTGDGTAYTIRYSPSTGSNDAARYYDNATETVPNTGIFTAKQGGIYQFTGSVYLGGVIDGQTIALRLISGGITYHLLSKKFTTAELTSGQVILSWAKKIKMLVNSTASVQLVVSGGGLAVDVLRGDASNGFTTFDGVKVA